MFNCNETKDIIEKEYNIIKKNKKINSDLFNSLINIDCNQEAWIKLERQIQFDYLSYFARFQPFRLKLVDQ